MSTLRAASSADLHAKCRPWIRGSSPRMTRFGEPLILGVARERHCRRPPRSATWSATAATARPRSPLVADRNVHVLDLQLAWSARGYPRRRSDRL